MVSRKAISPVVATALLLVVAVVAVVGFQSWFATFNSGVEADIDAQTSGATEGGLSVDRVESGNSTVNSDVYIKSPSEDVTVTSLSISVDGTEICSNSSEFLVSKGLASYSIDCTGNLSIGDKADVLLITDKDIVELTKTVR